MKRREFVLQGAALAAGAAAGSALLPRMLGAQPPASWLDDPDTQRAGACARSTPRAPPAPATPTCASPATAAGDGHARAADHLLQDGETFGFGVRVLAGGGWGFAASRDLNLHEVERVAREAVAQARANAAAMRRTPVELAPAEAYPDATWRSPIQTDPFEVPIEEKVALLLRGQRRGDEGAGARFATSSMFFLHEEKTFASTEGCSSADALPLAAAP